MYQTVSFCCEKESIISLMRSAECVWKDSIGWASRLSSFLYSQVRKGAFSAYVAEMPETRMDLLLNMTVDGISFSSRADAGFVVFTLFSKHPDISGCVIEVSANARGKMCDINVENL